MSRQDPGATTGRAEYPPPAPRCTCGAIEAVHTIRTDGSRGGCPHTRCQRYQPGEPAVTP